MDGGEKKMEKDYLIKLTLAVYKVTELFPEKEPLRYQIREKANEILAELISDNPGLSLEKKEELLEKIGAINAYFEIARYQNWVNEKNLVVLEREYAKLKNIQEFSEKNKELSSKEGRVLQTKKHQIKENPPKQPVLPKISPIQRQEKILNLLKYKKRITLSELRKIFPQVSSRTLRRDMEAIFKKGLISRKRKGQKDVAYQLIGNRTESGQDGTETTMSEIVRN
jgi:predicted HTH transcriptional regulator